MRRGPNYSPQRREGAEERRGARQAPTPARAQLWRTLSREL